MTQTKAFTALVLGASGLVGQALISQLLADSRYARVVCLVRTDVLQPQPGLTVVVADFNRMVDYAGYFSAEHIYVCLGTTLRRAGSRAAFRQVDFDLVYQAAQMACDHRAKSFVWISSVGANARSRSFYLRTKGELEEAIFSMSGLSRPATVRPSLLLGTRSESRPLESIGKIVATGIAPLLRGKLAKFKPVSAKQVAIQMMELQYFA